MERRAAMPLDLLLSTAEWLMSDSPNRYVRVVKRIWVSSVVAITVGVVAVSVIGGLTGHFAVPGDTKIVFLWGLMAVIGITVLAAVVAPLAFLLQKLGSTLGRATGNTNVHPD